MQNYVLPEFSETYSLILPYQTVYFEVYDKDFKYILNGNGAKLINNTLFLHRENFQESDFPINILTFSSEDGEAAIALFNQRVSMPTSTARFAIGKRNELARNINVKDFANYVNEGGSIYIGKDFTGFDYNAARENLDIYSKNEVRNFTRNIITQSSYNYTSNNVYLRPWMSQAFSSGSYHFQQGKFYTSFRNGFVDINIEFVARAYYTVETGFYRLCGIGEAIGQNWAPEQPIIVAPEVTSLPKEIRKYGDGQANQSINLNSQYNLPYLVITGAPYKMNGSSAPGESICTFNPYPRVSTISANGGQAAFNMFTSNQTIRYHIRYAVNDAQLT